MHAVWHWILYVLTWLSASPADIEHERAKCAGAVNVAYAALAEEPKPRRDDGKKNDAALPTKSTPCPTGNCPPQKR